MAGSLEANLNTKCKRSCLFKRTVVNRNTKKERVGTGELLIFPVAQLVEHGANNANIMGSIPRESKS